MRCNPLASIGLFSILVVSAAWSDEPVKSNGPAPASPPRALTGDDAQRARQLEQKISEAIRDDRWEEAVTAAEELVELRKRVQGEKHFEVVNAFWQLSTCWLVAAMGKEERAEFVSAGEKFRQAEFLMAKGKHAAAQPLFERALEIRRQLLTDDHPLKPRRATTSLAYNLWSPGARTLRRPSRCS